MKFAIMVVSKCYINRLLRSIRISEHVLWHKNPYESYCKSWQTLSGNLTKILIALYRLSQNFKKAYLCYRRYRQGGPTKGRRKYQDTKCNSTTISQSFVNRGMSTLVCRHHD